MRARERKGGGRYLLQDAVYKSRAIAVAEVFGGVADRKPHSSIPRRRIARGDSSSTADSSTVVGEGQSDQRRALKRWLVGWGVEIDGLGLGYMGQKQQRPPLPLFCQ